MKKNELNVLWTNANPVTAEHMVFLYTINAKKRNWFDEVKIIIWGDTARLAAENEVIRSLIKTALSVGVIVEGCLACASALEVKEELEALGVTLAYMGQPLTEILKSEAYLLTI
jgi:hypothetical protein